MSQMPIIQYIPLGPEPWGKRLERARDDIAGLTQVEAAELVSKWIFTSGSNISRLEALAEVPNGPRNKQRRFLAYCLALAYRIDPAEFDLGPDDVPPGVTVEPRTPRDMEISPTRWSGETPGHRHLAAVA